MTRNINLGIDVDIKYSFIICTKNSDRVLTEVLDSIFVQEVAPYNSELIVCDYKSSDDTLDIITKHLKEYNIDYSVISSLEPGKTPAMTLALDISRGSYAVIVDDDTVLTSDYIKVSDEILTSNKVGCVGARGLVDETLTFPDWFGEFQGLYAIGVPGGDTDWVWGACSIVNVEAWRALRNLRFELQLNPVRLDHSTPIALGGEDTELSLAIRMMGYSVSFNSRLSFTHKFSSDRLVKRYVFENTLGVCRSIPIHEVYRMAMNDSGLIHPKLRWTYILMKKVIKNLLKASWNGVLRNDLAALYHMRVLLGILSGYRIYYNRFRQINREIQRIKNAAPSH